MSMPMQVLAGSSCLNTINCNIIIPILKVYILASIFLTGYDYIH